MTMMLSCRSRLWRVATSPRLARCFSDAGPVASYAGRTKDKSKYTLTQQESPYKLGKHRSNALELIQKVPPIQVEGERATCDGGGGALGHPLEYISLQRPGEIKSCIYCGLRYQKKDDGH